jgi:hypothetical protein
MQANIEYIENSYSVADNTSNVTAKLWIRRTDTGHQTYGTGTAQIWWNSSGAGTYYNFSITPSQKITSAWYLLGQITFTVPHNANGTFEINVQGQILHSQFTTGWGVVAGDLTTIPRATTPSVSPASQLMGSKVTISTPRASSAFTHTLTYNFGGTSGTIASGVGTSVSWTIPASLANKIPNSTSGVGTITCYTYNGSSLIGTKAVAFTATVPNTADYQPTITSKTYAEATDGIASKFESFVQGKSTLDLAMTAAGAAGSTISSYKIQLQTAEGSQTYTVANATSNPIVGSSDLTITYTATDSRGRSVSETLTDTVLAYSTPTITGFSVKRVNQSGVEDDQGAYALATISASITPLNNNNNKQFVLQYKKTSEDTWTNVDVTPSGYSLDGFTQQVANMSTDDPYNFQLIATDYFGSAAMTDVLSTAYTIMDFRANGKGFAFGSVSTEDGFVINMPTKLPQYCPYDIGDVWITRSSAIPSEKWPGTAWTKDTGVVIRASISAEGEDPSDDGGQDAVTLTANQSGLRSHAHVTGPSSRNSPTETLQSPGWWWGTDGTKTYGTAGLNTLSTGTVAAQNASESHNNIPAFRAFNIWERIS